MRMWMVDPKFMCKNHLLGEHSEFHKHKWTFEKRHKKDNYILNNCLEPKAMQNRHDELAREMKRRGYSHKSPFVAPEIDYLPSEQQNHRIDVDKNLQMLRAKCSKCNSLFEKLRYKNEIS